jgi:hypothetical protein
MPLSWLNYGASSRENEYLFDGISISSENKGVIRDSFSQAPVGRACAGWLQSTVTRFDGSNAHPVIPCSPTNRMAKRTVYRKRKKQPAKFNQRTTAATKQHLAPLSTEHSAISLLDSNVWRDVEKGLNILVREAKAGNGQAFRVAQRILANKWVIPLAVEAKNWLTGVDLSVTEKVRVNHERRNTSPFKASNGSAEPRRVANAPTCDHCSQPMLGRVAPRQRFCSDGCRAAHHSAYYGKAGACQL